MQKSVGDVVRRKSIPNDVITKAIAKMVKYRKRTIVAMSRRLKRRNVEVDTLRRMKNGWKKPQLRFWIALSLQWIRNRVFRTRECKVFGRFDAPIRSRFIAHTFSLVGRIIHEQYLIILILWVTGCRCSEKVSTIHTDHCAGDQCEETENRRIVHDNVQR